MPPPARPTDAHRHRRFLAFAAARKCVMQQIPDQTVSISGTAVGLLDPTQAARLLSTPHSTLSFATFHPCAASASMRKLSVRDELCSGKRVVIEVLPSGECFWRWVPRAKGVENVADEGVWPRVVSICGYICQLCMLCLVLM